MYENNLNNKYAFFFTQTRYYLSQAIVFLDMILRVQILNKANINIQMFIFLGNVTNTPTNAASDLIICIRTSVFSSQYCEKGSDTACNIEYLKCVT